MKIFSFVLTIAAFITGLIAAYYWHRACKAGISPLWGEDGTEPADQHSSDMGWTVGIIQAFSESAKLNKTASMGTAVSVMLGTASTLVGQLFS